MRKQLYNFGFAILKISMILYFLACFKFALLPDAPIWARFGGWSMFTHKTVFHSTLKAFSINYSGEKTQLDLEGLFPAIWDSGPIYQRGLFRRNKRNMILLALNICERLPNIKQVHFYDVNWPIIPGESSEIIAQEKIKMNSKVECKI